MVVVSKPVASPETPEQRRLRTTWLESLGAAARGRQRVAALCTSASGVLLVVQAAAIAWLIQAVLVDGRPLADGAGMALLLGLALAGRALLGVGTSAAAGTVADTAKLTLRQRVYRKLQANGPLWLRSQRSGELGELMLAHGEAVDGYFAGFQPVRTEMVVVPLLILAAVAWVNWVVALILLFTGPLVPIFMMLVGWGAEAASRGQLREMARLGGHFADRLKGLGLLRVYGRGQDELEQVAQASEELRQRSMRVLRIAFLSSTTLEFFASVSVAMVALYFGLSYLGLMELGIVMPLLVVAAALGDQMNYSIGRFFGPKVWQWEHSRFFNKHAFRQAHDFYEKYGGITIMLARFLPFIRTFVPFVAGVAAMGRRKFTLYNVAGALVWVVGLVTLGYLFGNLPWVKANLSLIIWAMIIVPGLVALAGAWRARRKGTTVPG